MRKTVAAVFVLAAAVVLLYYEATRLWWMRDDAFHLRLLASHEMSEMLLSPAFWRQLPNSVFTPLILTSLDADLTVAGPDPRAFYVHQLLALAAAAIALFFVFRLWLSISAALAGTLLVVAGRPACDVVAYLAHRHYIEGLLLAAVATLLIVTGIRRDSLGLSAAGAIAYLASMTAKEVYIPLIVLLAVVPEGSVRDRLRHLAPSAGAVVVYIVLRLVMLGMHFTAYGWTVSGGDILTLPFRAIWEMSGVALLPLVIAALLFVISRSSRSLWVVAVGAIAALVPLVPVAFRIEARFVLVAWVLTALAIARSHRVILYATLVVALIVNRITWEKTYGEARRMSDEGRAFVRMTPSDILLHPAIPPAAIKEIQWVDAELLRDPPSGSFLYDELPLCAGRARGEVYSWDGKRVSRVAARAFCTKIRELPMSARFSYGEGTLRWSLAPEGQYRFVLADGAQAFDVPREAGFRLNLPALTLRVRRETDAGWVTYSPDLTIPLSEGARLEWHR